MTASRIADAVLLITSQCPHCASMLKSLVEIVKRGELASLEIINLDKKPEMAERLGVRSVPWMKIGWIELTGLHSEQELVQKAQQAGSEQGALAYISEELSDGRVSTVLSLINERHELMSHVLALLDEADAKINIRLGVGVVLEACAAADWFVPYIAQLAEFTRHNDARVRADACHYLSLTENKEAVPHISALLDDASAEVREVAEESLQELRELGLKF